MIFFSILIWFEWKRKNEIGGHREYSSERWARYVVTLREKLLPGAGGKRCKLISCRCNNSRELVLKLACLARDKSLSVATNVRSFWKAINCIKILPVFIKLEKTCVTLRAYLFDDRQENGRNLGGRNRALLQHCCRRFTTARKATGRKMKKSEWIYGIFLAIATLTNPTYLKRLAGKDFLNYNEALIMFLFQIIPAIIYLSYYNKNS